MVTGRLTWERSEHIRYAATISPCGHYRYDLEREFDPGGRWVMFLGCNPSTADGQKDDHTIRREMDFGHGFGFPNLVKCNLYALRSTDPRGVVDAKVDPVGPDNDGAIRRWLPRVSLVVLAWGYQAKIGPRMLTRAWEVRRLLRQELGALGDRAPQVGHLGLTKGKEKQPLHPLRLRADTPLTSLAL